MTKPKNLTQELFAAIQKSDAEQVKRLLALEIALNEKDANGQTALTLASSIGNLEIIQLLISAGAPVNLEPEPLVFNPQITGTELPGGANLGELIAQATQDAPEETKNFYADFTAVVDALSKDSTQVSDREANEKVLDEEQLRETEESEDDEYEEYDNPRTPLEAAVFKGDLSTLRILLRAGADPNPPVWYETPVLVIAAAKGQVEIVRELIAAGANVDRGFDELPLHTAAQKGHLEVVHLLLDAGANVEGYEEDYWTALMSASLAGHLDIVRLLVERGADVNAWSQGETPLMLAAREVHREVYDFLYPLVSDEIRAIGDRDAEREMAITLKRRFREGNKAVEELVDAAMYGNLKQVQQLIASGVDVNAVSACNRTALSLAIQGGQIPIIEALLDAGGDPNIPDETDDGLAANSPLMEAASTFFATNRGDMVRLLVRRGADVNQQDAEGLTALMHALGYSDIDVMGALIEAGADLDMRDNEGNTALMMATYDQLTKAISILQQAGASQKGIKEVELIEVVEQGDVDRVKILLQENLDVNVCIGERTALCEAAMEGHQEIAKLLVAAGADVNKPRGDFNPLLDAAYNGHLEVVRVLLEAGADVHVRVKDYLNPLESAELGKLEGNNKGQPYDEVIALLESYGATKSAEFSD